MATRAELLEQQLNRVGRLWWLWLVMGIVWIGAAILILQFDDTSVRTIGVLAGVFLIVQGFEDLTFSRWVSGWRWLWIIFGVVLIGAGIVALVNPVDTFISLADMLGFLLAIVGVMWIIEALLSRDSNDAWWLGLVSGILMLALGFMASGQLLVDNAYTLMMFVGIWLLIKGVFDILRAFRIKKLGKFEIDVLVPGKG